MIAKMSTVPQRLQHRSKKTASCKEREIEPVFLYRKSAMIQITLKCHTGIPLMLNTDYIILRIIHFSTRTISFIKNCNKLILCGNISYLYMLRSIVCMLLIKLTLIKLQPLMFNYIHNISQINTTTICLLPYTHFIKNLHKSVMLYGNFSINLTHHAAVSQIY